MNDTAISLRLGAWWEANARDLPWRFGRATPWGVLVSEVMSQQTQMSRVVPYWTDWMERWPDARALAEAPKAEVITAWGRLGYPRRALRLQECARVVAEDYADKLPRTYDELTASRGGATSPAERALANRMLPKDEILGCDADVADNAGSAEHVVNSTIRGGKRSRLHRGERPSVTWNQSVMELGAVICTAKSPLCDTCPIADDCAFLKAGRPGLGERRTRPRQRFQGTDRQVRGLVLAALRELPAGATLPREDADKLWKDQIQLAACIASLDDDGLIEILDGGLRLPS